MNEWISVKDRLPENSGLVNIVKKGVVSAGFCEGGWWWDINGRSGEVTHWQPLPEPPKPEGPFGFRFIAPIALGDDGYPPAVITFEGSPFCSNDYILNTRQAKSIACALNELWAERVIR
jgi:hypothetical protein